MFIDRVTCRESCKRHMAVGGKVRRGKRGFSAMANDISTCKCTTIWLLCSFAVPEQLKSAFALVLFFFFVFLCFFFFFFFLLLFFLLLLLLLLLLVLLLLLLLLVLLLLLLLLLLQLQHIWFSHFCGPKKPSNRLCFRMFDTLERKNGVNLFPTPNPRGAPPGS